MKTKKIFLGVLLLIALGMVAGFISTPPKIQAVRGKVLSSSGSKIHFKDPKVIKASFSPFQTVTDSTDVISGDICILNEKDQPTGRTIPFQPRRFPKWFEFGCEDEGDFIEYIVVANGTKAIITRIPKRN